MSPEHLCNAVVYCGVLDFLSLGSESWEKSHIRVRIRSLFVLHSVQVGIHHKYALLSLLSPTSCLVCPASVPPVSLVRLSGVSRVCLCVYHFIANLWSKSILRHHSDELALCRAAKCWLDSLLSSWPERAVNFNLDDGTAQMGQLSFSSSEPDVGHLHFIMDTLSGHSCCFDNHYDLNRM